MYWIGEFPLAKLEDLELRALVNKTVGCPIYYDASGIITVAHCQTKACRSYSFDGWRISSLNQ